MADVVLEKHKETALMIDNEVQSLVNIQVQGVQKALVLASVIGNIRTMLTDEFMQPIMQLQGTKLGFRTDRDVVKNRNTGKYEKGQGYPMPIVRDCFIEALSLGLQPTGNMWNIIGGNLYPTKEGFSYALNNIPNLKADYTYTDIKQSADKQSANVKVKIDWEYNGEKDTKTIDFPIKSDAYTTVDALIGKAERKAKCWLYNKIKGTNVSDGDVMDIPHEEINPVPNAKQVSEEKERERVIKHIEKSKTLDELARCQKAIKDDDHDLIIMYDDKARELQSKA